MRRKETMSGILYRNNIQNSIPFIFRYNEIDPDNSFIDSNESITDEQPVYDNVHGGQDNDGDGATYGNVNCDTDSLGTCQALYDFDGE